MLGSFIYFHLFVDINLAFIETMLTYALCLRFVKFKFVSTFVKFLLVRRSVAKYIFVMQWV